MLKKRDFSQLDNEEDTFDHELDTAQDISLKRHDQAEEQKHQHKRKIFTKKVLLVISIIVMIGICFVIATRKKEIVFRDFSYMKYVPDELRDPANEIYPPEKQQENFAKFQPVPTFAVDRRNKLLCNLSPSPQNPYCQSKFIVDSLDLLYIICPIYSFGRAYDTLLYQLHTNFENYMKSIGIPLVTFEAIRSYTDEEYILTKPNNEPHEMQGYYNNISYVRENLLNVAINRLKVDWEYVAWIDAHQIFDNIFWWEEAIHKAEHHTMVQLFDDAIRFDGNNKTVIFRAGFFKLTYQMQNINEVNVGVEFGNAHMLSRDSYYNKIGYIHDECFASGCDLAYGQAAMPKGTLYTLEPGWKHYNTTHQEWVARVKPKVNGSRAYVAGNVYHLDHMSSFLYAGLRAIVDRADYDVKRDVHYDENGVLYLSNQPLAKQIEKYFYDNL